MYGGTGTLEGGELELQSTQYSLKSRKDREWAPSAVETVP
jgi:hypothetical protein